MTESEKETIVPENTRKVKAVPGIGLPAGSDYPKIDEISSEPCNEVFWRKEVGNAFEIANNGYSFYRVNDSAIFAKDLSGYFYKLNNATKCFEFLFEGFKDTTDYTRMSLPPQAPTFVGFNYLHQAVFPMDDEGRPILPKDDKGKTIFPYYDNYPLFPVDDSGRVCVPLGDDGKHVFPQIPHEFGAYVPCDAYGRVVLPLDEKGEPIYPRAEDGTVLMPFIILQDGSIERAVYRTAEGVPVLPFHNGEPALEVHDGEVLFPHEYQQKMMELAQNGGVRPTVVDELFYKDHASQYQYQQVEPNQLYSYQHHQYIVNAPPTKTTTPAANLLQKQLSFLKKKKVEAAAPASPAVAAPKVIPTDRPSKPNKEKERGERYIPEPSRRPFQKREEDRGRKFRREEPSRRSSRSRSLTWSPINEKKRSRSPDHSKSRKRSEKDRKRERSRSADRKKRRHSGDKYSKSDKYVKRRS